MSQVVDMKGRVSPFVEALCAVGGEAAVDAKEKEIAEYVERESASRLCFELRCILLSACGARDWAHVRSTVVAYMKLINKKVIDGFKFIVVLDDILDSNPYPECKNAFGVIEDLAIEFKDFIVRNSHIKYKIFTGPFNRFTKRIVGIDPALSGSVKAFMIFVFPDLDPKREDHLAAPISEVALTEEQKAELENSSKSQYDAFWAAVGITKTPGSFLAAIKGDPKVISSIETSVYAPLRKKCVVAKVPSGANAQKVSVETFSSIEYLKSPIIFSLQLEDPAFARVVVTQIVMSAHHLHKNSHPELSQQIKEELHKVVDAGLDLLARSAADGKPYAAMLKKVLEWDSVVMKRQRQQPQQPQQQKARIPDVVMPHQVAAKINKKDGASSYSSDEYSFREFCEGMSAPRSGYEDEKAPEVDLKEFLNPFKEFYDKKGADAANDEKVGGNPMGNQLYKWRALRVTAEKRITAMPEFIEKDSKVVEAVYHIPKPQSQQKPATPKPQQSSGKTTPNETAQKPQEEQQQQQTTSPTQETVKEVVKEVVKEDVPVKEVDKEVVPVAKETVPVKEITKEVIPAPTLPQEQKDDKDKPQEPVKEHEQQQQQPSQKRTSSEISQPQQEQQEPAKKSPKLE